MVEKIIVDSSVISVPIAVRSKDDPAKLNDFVINFDIGDTALMNAKNHQREIQTKLNELKQQYQAVMDKEITNENLAEAVEAINGSLRVMFDGDFGEGMYDKIAQAGGGNSFVNMLELYTRVNDVIADQVESKVHKITQRSNNRKAKYLKKRRNR